MWGLHAELLTSTVSTVTVQGIVLSILRLALEAN